MSALPSPVVVLSVVAVAMAGLALVATDGPGEEDRVTVVSREADPAPSATPSPTRRAEPARRPAKAEERPPAVERDEVVVEVYNQSGITGLAGRVADRTSDIGWQVVGSDNWVGTIPASTVYFPPRLRRAGEILARDLGVGRVMPAVEPMRFDRLTVILTGPLG